MQDLYDLINPPVSEAGLFTEAMRDHRGTERELDDWYWKEEMEVWE